MKKAILLLATSAFLTLLTLTSCTSPAEKVEDAKKDVVAADENLNDAEKAYQADIEAYRQASADKIAENERSISALKERAEDGKKEDRYEYKSSIAMLEMKNTNLKKKMHDYKADDKDKWESFKAEFGHDMTELGQALKDLTVKNIK